jgi:molybdenum cofactor biosynthesis enzyme
MIKAADRSMVLTEVRLVRKTGGQRGDYERP